MKNVNRMFVVCPMPQWVKRGQCVSQTLKLSSVCYLRIVKINFWLYV
jgi:hypothetical protein